MKKLCCEGCGAPLPLPKQFEKYIKCPYCNASYEVEGSINQTIEYCVKLIEPGFIETFSATSIMPEDHITYYPKEVLAECVKRDLAQKIAELIMKKMTVYEEFDIQNFKRVYRADIRIATRRP